jgi:hypothetical protein
MNKGVLFIGGVADGEWIAVSNKTPHYKIPIPPKCLHSFESVPEEDTLFHYDTYTLYWWFDELPMYIEEHMSAIEGIKRLAKYYRPENQDENS